MNVLPNEIQNNSVSSTMFMKLTIKVVAFFLGHPVYQSISMQALPTDVLRITEERCLDFMNITRL